MPAEDYASSHEERVHWGFTKILMIVVLYGLSLACIILGLKPLFDMEFEIKSFANLTFVAFHAFYMFSFMAVHKKSHFIFWSITYLFLSGISLLFYFYEDLFL
ncbi:leptin receptor [Encephalitozoon intestinalis ATCC 50506]|uniref:Leptin receptor n=1 Tax=Encephalitozoon intestinalis (strain ATCC 50506) TaxID=876142 RepID=E0S5E0_ENCIT|nr:leptin receptor [Encephalitozoon intestinalis ATCC 50506]ADM10925.1 leptin receptor [Encephalitozoon intestinalis ATCC 50506]UTX44559.1 hypothetical protein GPK93_01g00680 [Encephalitozoon intestinalis]